MVRGKVLVAGSSFFRDMKSCRCKVAILLLLVCLLVCVSSIVA